MSYSHHPFTIERAASPIGVVALSPSQDAILFKSDVSRRISHQTPIGSPLLSPSPAESSVGAPGLSRSWHQSHSAPIRRFQPHVGFQGSPGQAPPGPQRVHTPASRPAAEWGDFYVDSALMTQQPQISQGGVGGEAAVFDFDALDEGWLQPVSPGISQSPRGMYPAHVARIASTMSPPSLQSAPLASTSPMELSPMDILMMSRAAASTQAIGPSSFPDNYLLRSQFHAVSHSPAAPVWNSQHVPYMNQTSTQQATYPPVVQQQPPSTSHDSVLRRRAVSVGHSNLSSSYPTAPGSNGLQGPNHLHQPPVAAAQGGFAPSTAVSSGSAVSTKHSSRVIAVLNSDTLHEVGVDLQALYDVFQQFGPVRSLDHVSASIHDVSQACAPPSSPSIGSIPLARPSGHSSSSSTPGGNIVLVSFYDLRHAQKAMAALNGKPMGANLAIARGAEPIPLVLQYFVLRDFPPTNPGPNALPSTSPLQSSAAAFAHVHQPQPQVAATSSPANYHHHTNNLHQQQNQGTLVIFNLEPSVTNEELREIFGQFGEVKEIRESPNKKHKFVEFYDVRCAEKAMRALNKTDIKGRKIKIEPSRPGGTQSRKPSAPIPVPTSATSSFALSPTSPGVPSHLSTSPSTSSTQVYAAAQIQVPIAPVAMDSTDSVSPSLMQSLSDLVDLHRQQQDEPTNKQLGLALGSSPLLLSSHLYLPLDSLTPEPAGQLSSLEPLHQPLSTNSIHQGRPKSGPLDIDPPLVESSVSLSPLDVPVLRLPLPPLPEESEVQKFENSHQDSAGPGPATNIRPLVHSGPRRSHRSNSMPPAMLPEGPIVTAPVEKVVTPPAILSVPGSPIHSAKERRRVRSISQSSPSTEDASLPNLPPKEGSTPNSGSSSPISSPGNSARGSVARPHSPVMVSSALTVRTRHSRERERGPQSGKLSGLLRRERSSSEGSQRLASMRTAAAGTQSPDEINSNNGSQPSSLASSPSSRTAYELDLDRVRAGEDTRTTLMIKNIPNKYDQDMLLQTINKQHIGLYDFFYLPIDFKNKCNVGYAFINFIDPKSIPSFFEEINNKKWERFNSEKVCQISYARIQGKTAMVEHFKNSSLMFEDPKCRPLLFVSDGPMAGQPEPFPVGLGVRPRGRRDSVGSGSATPESAQD